MEIPVDLSVIFSLGSQYPSQSYGLALFTTTWLIWWIQAIQAAMERTSKMIIIFFSL